MINRINRRDEIAGSDIERLFNCAVDVRIPTGHNVNSALKASLGTIAEGEPKAKGIALEEEAAGRFSLADDGSDAPEAYRPYTTPSI